jgi:hypothetical protein
MVANTAPSLSSRGEEGEDAHVVVFKSMGGVGVQKDDRVVGLDTYCSMHLTFCRQLLGRLENDRKFVIQGHTDNCVERVSTTGSNELLGQFIYYPEASGTILSVQALDKTFFITMLANCQRAKLTHRINRKFQLDFNMEVKGYEGTLSCKLNNDQWSQLTSGNNVYAKPSVVDELDLSGPDAPISKADFEHAVEYIAGHNALGHPGHKTFIRTMEHSAIEGIPRFSKRVMDLATEIMGGKCVVCAAVNPVKIKAPAAPKTPTVAVAEPPQRSEEELRFDKKLRRLGCDLAYFNEEAFLVVVDSFTGYIWLSHLKDGKATGVLTSALRRVISDFKRSVTDKIAFDRIYCRNRISEAQANEPVEKLVKKHLPDLMESDAEPGLTKAMRLVGQEHGIAVEPRAAGSHVAYCERNIREVRRKQTAITISVPHKLGTKEMCFSVVEAGLLNNLMVHSDQRQSPFEMLHKRKVRWCDITAVCFGDAVMATRMTTRGGAKGARQEIGMCLGHVPRLQHGIVFFNVFTKTAMPRTHYFRVPNIDLTGIMGVNKMALPPIHIAKTLDTHLIQRSRAMNDGVDRNLPYTRQWDAAGDPEYSPEPTVATPQRHEVFDQLDEGVDLNLDNMRHDLAQQILPGVSQRDVMTELNTGANRQLDFDSIDDTSDVDGSDDVRRVTMGPEQVDYIDEAVPSLGLRGDDDEISPADDSEVFQSVEDRQATPIPFNPTELDVAEAIRDVADGEDGGIDPTMTHDNPGSNGRKRSERDRRPPERFRASPSRSKGDKDVSWKDALDRWGTTASTSQDKEIQQLVDHGVFEPTLKLNHEVEHVYKARGFSTVKSSDPFELKSRVVVTMKTGKNRNQPTDFGMNLYSATLDLKLFLTMLTLGAELDLELSAFDVKSAYCKTFTACNGIYVLLNNEITASAVRVKPEWRQYVRTDGTMMVEAIMAWYGMPPSAALWNRDMHDTLVRECGYTQHSMVFCIYYRKVEGKWNFILLHVDDLGCLFGRDRKEKLRVQRILEQKYGQLKETSGDYILYIGMGVRWMPNEKEYRVDMTKYIEKLCSKYKIKRGAVSPYRSQQRELTEEEQSPVDVTEYRSLIGALRYVVNVVFTACGHAVSILSTRQVSPTVDDFNEAIRILKFMFMTRERYVRINKCGPNPKLKVWVDGAYGWHVDGRSHTGILLKFGKCRGAIFVGSWKQTPLASSSGNCEVIALNTGVQFGNYWHDWVTELDIWGDELKVVYYEDNSSVVDMVTGTARANEMKEKYMRVRINLLREEFNKHGGHSSLVKVTTKEQMADGQTKIIGGAALSQHDDFVRGYELKC